MMDDRHGDQRQDHGPPVLQEHQHDEADQRHGLQQRLDHVHDRFADERRRVVGDVVVDAVGKARLQLFHLAADARRPPRGRWCRAAGRRRGRRTACRRRCRTGCSSGRPARRGPRRAGGRRRAPAGRGRGPSSRCRSAAARVAGGDRLAADEAALPPRRGRPSCRRRRSWRRPWSCRRRRSCRRRSVGAAARLAARRGSAGLDAVECWRRSRRSEVVASCSASATRLSGAARGRAAVTGCWSRDYRLIIGAAGRRDRCRPLA